jgi:hypothetical protein
MWFWIILKWAGTPGGMGLAFAHTPPPGIISSAMAGDYYDFIVVDEKHVGI